MTPVAESMNGAANMPVSRWHRNVLPASRTRLCMCGGRIVRDGKDCNPKRMTQVNDE